MKKKNLHKPIDPTIIRVSTVSMSLRYLLPGQLGYLNQYYHIIGVSSPGPDLKFVKEKENISVYPVCISRKNNIIKDLMSLISLIIIFRRIKPEIVHSITPKAGFLSMLAAFIAKTPIRMHTFTGLIFPSKKG